MVITTLRYHHKGKSGIKYYFSVSKFLNNIYGTAIFPCSRLTLATWPLKNRPNPTSPKQNFDSSSSKSTVAPVMPIAANKSVSHQHLLRSNYEVHSKSVYLAPFSHWCPSSRNWHFWPELLDWSPWLHRKPLLVVLLRAATWFP